MPQIDLSTTCPICHRTDNKTPHEEYHYCERCHLVWIENIPKVYKLDTGAIGIIRFFQLEVNEEQSTQIPSTKISTTYHSTITS